MFRARVRVRVRVRIRVRVRVRLEDVEVAELDGGVLERVLLLAHGAGGAQRQGLLFRQAEELPVLGDVERGGLPSRDGLLLLFGRGFGLGLGLGRFAGDRVRVRKNSAEGWAGSRDGWAGWCEGARVFCSCFLAFFATTSVRILEEASLMRSERATASVLKSWPAIEPSCLGSG